MTTITINRDVFAQHIQGLIEVMRMPNSEHVADAHNKAVRFLRAALAAQQPAPAWHDAPTEPGIWLCDEGGPDCYTYTAHNIVLLNDPALKDDECRWYGPIPQGGAKAEGGAG